MRLLYALGIRLYGLLLRLLSPFHPKAKAWVDGREGLFQQIKQTVEPGQKHAWFHFASLGEFEQGRAVLEALRQQFPQQKIVITFFSPSGYEIRKNTNLADHVFYLPEDTAANAAAFIRLINPSYAVFTKYEYWNFYFKDMGRQQIPIFMISAIFREGQSFFKPWGGFFRGILKQVTFFFVQNKDSIRLLKDIGIVDAAVAGDTRFDRVLELPKAQRNIPQVASFIGLQEALVVGSSWPQDEQLLVHWAAAHPSWKLLLAPHEIHETHIQAILKLFPQALRFSMFESYAVEQVAQAQVLIIDNIGMLSSLYGYGKIAYIGGGFGAGIHNTLEAATYGMPVIFGPKYYKFQEAKDLIEEGAAFSITDAAALNKVFDALTQEEKLLYASAQAKQYVQRNAGATAIILKYLKGKGLLS